MGLTEQLFGSGAERFADCVEIKIAELNEKHKDFLSEEKVDLSTAYRITFGQSGVVESDLAGYKTFPLRLIRKLIEFHMNVPKSIYKNYSTFQSTVDS